MSFDEIHHAYEIITAHLGIKHLGGQSIHQLSGGEKQKVSFARAMIKNPSLVIADEPTGNLDWESTKEIAKLMLASNKLGHTIVVITHDVLFAKYIRQHCDVRLLQLQSHVPRAIQSASSYTRESLLPHAPVPQSNQS
jgi:ABC-type lipoprotein export system ATPase subunit